jgi:hypothetical protein
MGQQQILFLILAVCIIGIAMSTGIIVLQSDSSVDYRQAISTDLKILASEAQAYRHRSFEEGGGDGSFIGLTATPQGIEKLTKTRLTSHADYSIKKSGNSHFVQIMAIGHSPGNDARKPIKMLITVFAETTSIAVLN